MKKRLIYLSAILLMMISSITLLHAQDNDAQWEASNKLYMDGNYEDAINKYTQIVDSGYGSSELFYNLGNSYYKTGQLGKSILNYNRALRLDPFNKDIKHNLTLANAQVKTHIEPVPIFFLTQWNDTISSLFSSDGWAILSLIMVGLTLATLSIFIFSISPLARKFFFTIFIISLVVFVLSLSFSIKQKNIIQASGEAIVMYNASPAKSSPDADSDDLFVIDEGTKVVIKERIGEWCEVEILRGNRGWMEAKNIELIDLAPNL